MSQATTPAFKLQGEVVEEMNMHLLDPLVFLARGSSSDDELILKKFGFLCCGRKGFLDAARVVMRPKYELNRQGRAAQRVEIRNIKQV